MVSENKRHHTFPYFADASKNFKQRNALRIASLPLGPTRFEFLTARNFVPRFPFPSPHATNTRGVRPTGHTRLLPAKHLPWMWAETK